MSRQACVIVGAVMGLSGLAACIPGLGDCAMKPLAGLPIGAVVAPIARDPAPIGTSCASVVEFNGRLFYPTGGDGRWTLEIEDLEPIGLASAANEPAWEDPTVFAIEGVAPEDAIAMHYGSGATIAVLIAEDLPPTLCRYLAAPEAEPACAADVD